MITVEDARALVKEFEDNKKNEFTQKVKNFCDTVISPLIEEKAKEGKRFAGLEVDPQYICGVLEELKQQNWSCYICGNKRIEIRW